MYCSRRDRALSIIVMAIEPRLLYLIGDDPEDPEEVYNKLCNTFMKKTWANKLRLRKQLFSLKLTSGVSVHEHIKKYVEIFSKLAVLGDAVEEEDRVIYLLPSLPDAYNTLFTALEAQEQVPSWEVVTEKLLNEEVKQKSKPSTHYSHGALVSKASSSSEKHVISCYEFGKTGHIRRNCRVFLKKKEAEAKPKAAVAEADATESCGLIATATTVCAAELPHAWIMDSGATKHMCCNKDLFSELIEIRGASEIKVGDGRCLQTTGFGKVSLKIKLTGNILSSFELVNILFVPELAYNLISVSELTKAGKITSLYRKSCEIFDHQNEFLAVANKRGELYYCQNKKYNVWANKICFLF